MFPHRWASNHFPAYLCKSSQAAVFSSCRSMQTGQMPQTGANRDVFRRNTGIRKQCGTAAVQAARLATGCQREPDCQKANSNGLAELPISSERAPNGTTHSRTHPQLRERKLPNCASMTKNNTSKTETLQERLAPNTTQTAAPETHCIRCNITGLLRLLKANNKYTAK